MLRNLFARIPEELPEELIEPLMEKPGLRIERIISRGHASPEGFWYDQDTNEFVLLLSGTAELEFREPAERLTLGPGHWMIITPGRPHRVLSTSSKPDAVWLAVHF